MANVCQNDVRAGGTGGWGLGWREGNGKEGEAQNTKTMVCKCMCMLV